MNIITYPNNYRLINKVWGREIWIKNWDHYCLKFLLLYPTGKCAMHCHKMKIETFYVQKGSVVIEVDDNIFLLNAGESITIDPNQNHSFCSAHFSREAEIIEVSTQHFEEDSYRVKDNLSHKMSKMEFDQLIDKLRHKMN